MKAPNVRLAYQFLLVMKLVYVVATVAKIPQIMFMPVVKLVLRTPRSSTKTRSFTIGARAIAVGAEFVRRITWRKIVITKRTPHIRKLSE